jgi:predicted lipoprotein
MNTIKKTALLGVAITTLIACKKDDPIVTASNSTSYASNLENIATNVITETYVELSNKSVFLYTESVNLKANQTASNLDNTRSSWRDTRVPWEKSEGFLFGPVDTKGVDPAIDSWPVNVVDLNNVLSSSVSLTETYIDGLIGELKGFHTIEYLLWGATGNKQIGDFTPREFDYLLAVTENLKNKTKILSDSWLPSGDNFANNLIKAGKSGSIYISEKAAFEELVEGMIAIADEVANGKINDPFSQNNLTLEESQFSHNSKNDFANNIRSISNVYNGKFNISGLGIYDIIKEKNSTLADRLNTEISDAITAVESIPGTFSSAVTSQSITVTNAKNKITIIKTTLESEIKSVINSLVL